MPSQDLKNLIFCAGTQVVIRKDVYAQNNRIAHSAGAVGVIVQAPVDRSHAYRVKFADNFEAAVQHEQLVRLKDYKREASGSTAVLNDEDLSDRETPELNTVD